MRSDIINENSNNYGGNAEGLVKIPDAETYTCLAADSGKIHSVPDLTATCTISLPAEEKGLVFEFWYSGAANDAQNIVITSGSDTNYFVGGVCASDSDATGAATVDGVYSNGSSHSKLTAATPEGGTWFKFVCDGLLWYVTGNGVSATPPVFAGS